MAKKHKIKQIKHKWKKGVYKKPQREKGVYESPIEEKRDPLADITPQTSFQYKASVSPLDRKHIRDKVFAKAFEVLKELGIPESLINLKNLNIKEKWRVEDDHSVYGRYSPREHRVSMDLTVISDTIQYERTFAHEVSHAIVKLLIRLRNKTGKKYAPMLRESPPHGPRGIELQRQPHGSMWRD